MLRMVAAACLAAASVHASCNESAPNNHPCTDDGPPIVLKRRPVFLDDDMSRDAADWRARKPVLASRRLLAALPYRYANRTVQYSWPSKLGDQHSITLSELAFVFELSIGDVGLRPRMFNAGGDEQAIGPGVVWWGVGSQQSVFDSAMIHEMLWRVKPDLLIEIGTWCGGGTIMYAKTMVEYNSRAKVITVDPANAEKRWECIQKPGSQWYKSLNPFGQPGVQSPFWSSLKASGNLVHLVGDPATPKNLRRLSEAAANANRVLIVDDGDHNAEPLVRHFHALSGLVTPGSYYLVQDPRLDYDCAYTILTRKSIWPYCRKIVLYGGPSGAVANITASPGFDRDWVQDRSVERWAVTQHPGGYLRRRGAAAEQ